jgi:hypothetical protein
MFVAGKVKKNVWNVTVKVKLSALFVMEMELKSVQHVMVLENVNVGIATDLEQLMTMITTVADTDT